MIGTTLLNRYKIEAELGKGGMGVVYKAHDALLDRVVAIKFLNAAGIGTSGKTRLLAEARAAAKLNHPNIVSVFDAGEVDNNPFIVMELVEGKTLRGYSVPNLAEALKAATEICKALDHAHTKGIIHRDLKLENIIITDSQVIKLMDFGLARTADQAHLTEAGTIIGTFAYLAPELIQGEAASPQSDLYALGVILYELLTGISPFSGTITEILSQHLHGKVQPPSTRNPNVPEWLDNLVLHLLAKHPEERPTSARAVLDILDQKVAPAITDTYKATPKPRNNLPAQNTSFIGREKEIAEIKKELEAHRLVTLTGSGGTGKTRLSLQVAADSIYAFPDGVWFVELAVLADSELIPQTILSTIGIVEQPGKPLIESLKEYLYEKQLLIVLDNCEHLIEASAQVANTLLSGTLGIKILASSREAFGVAGELSYHVPSLSLPDINHLPANEQLSQ
jgi:non-specific serine/threonine protein kinase